MRAIQVMLSCIVLCYCLLVVNSELITASLGAIIAAASGWYQWNFIKENTVCHLKECCTYKEIPYDLSKLKTSLSEQMFGQPLVNELNNILRAHKETIENDEAQSRKALVLSFHGWSGVGKNYAANIIADAIYKRGLNSKFVKLFMGKKDFPCSDLESVKAKIFKEISMVVKECGQALIIIDEVHDMCPTVLDVIKPFLDHHHNVDGIDYRNAIFIFISNIGGNEISNRLLELYDEGYVRDNVKFHNFEPLIRKVSYYTGGFEKSTTIAHQLIDHYIPFLPLEQRHVEMCALKEFRSHGVFVPTEEMMADALSIITYGPREDRPIFANNGCKRFTRHIPYIIQKHRNKITSKNKVDM